MQTGLSGTNWAKGSPGFVKSNVTLVHRISYNTAVARRLRESIRDTILPVSVDRNQEKLPRRDHQCSIKYEEKRALC